MIRLNITNQFSSTDFHFCNSVVAAVTAVVVAAVAVVVAAAVAVVAVVVVVASGLCLLSLNFEKFQIAFILFLEIVYLCAKVVFQ